MKSKSYWPMFWTVAIEVVLITALLFMLTSSPDVSL